MPQKWSKEIVVTTILKRHRSGKKLNSGYIQIKEHSLYNAANTWWGGWREAIEGAGLIYNDVRLKERHHPVWSEKKIIAIIRKMKRERRPLNSNHTQTKEKNLYGAACKYFGGWPQAIAAAGFEYRLLRKRTLRSWTRQGIAEAIIKRSQSGLSIAGGIVTNEDRGLYHAAQRHFGEKGWSHARMLAGFPPIDPDPRVIWTKQTVCDEIKRLYESEVLLNTGSLQGTEYAYILAAGCKVFGNWSKAIRSAGLDYSRIRRMRQPGWWTNARVLMAIRNLEKRGVRLSSKAVQSSNASLFRTAGRFFGSWSQAVEAAGIPYRQHCLVWSTKAWLRRMDDAAYTETVSGKLTRAARS